MLLNSFVTPEGGEIERAQVLQAEACRIPPPVDMNPILLKLESETRAEVVVWGLCGLSRRPRRIAIRKRICGRL